MAYDQRGNAFDGGSYGKRPRGGGDGNGYGMQQPPKRMMQEYGGNMGPGVKSGPSYGTEYGSPPQKMSRQSGAGSMHEEKPSNVLLFTIINPKYPITVDVMHTICQPHATVNRIVIFRKNGVQAMVEFETVDDAERTKDALDGADIYSGCCTLKIQWGKPTRLNVIRNDGDSWDYTNPNLGKEMKSQPLLPDPKFEPSMYGEPRGPGGHMEGPPVQPRRGPPPPQMDYGYDNYGSEPPMESYRGPPGGPGPGPQGRYPPQRQQQDPYGEMYGPPRGQPPMHGGPSRPGPSNAPPYGVDYEDESRGGRMMQQPQGAVLMAYGLNAEKMNCQRLFNLFCLYGNVIRVKFLKSKDGVAMIQLGDNASCQRAIHNLNSSYIFGSKMMLGMSKQAFIQDVHNPIDLPDGSPSFLDFVGSRNNRFSTPEAAAKNRIQPSSKALYFYNSPPSLDEDALQKVFIELELKPPTSIKIFPAKSERSSTGILEWDNKGDAVEALIVANHTLLPNPSGKNPYIMKLCFSGQRM